MRRIVTVTLPLMLFLSCSFTPSSDLGKAVVAGELPEVQRLLAAGANPNPPVSGREPSPLAWAARLGRVDLMDALLAAGANPAQGTGVNDWTPLVHAVHKSQEGAVELLLARTHPDAGSLDKALTMAAGYGTTAIVHKLLDAGARPTPDALTDAVGGAWDIDGEWNGCGPHTETVRALLTTAPGLRVPESYAGRAALRFAKKKGCTEMLSLVQGEVRAAR